MNTIGQCRSTKFLLARFNICRHIYCTPNIAYTLHDSIISSIKKAHLSNKAHSIFLVRVFELGLVASQYTDVVVHNSAKRVSRPSFLLQDYISMLNALHALDDDASYSHRSIHVVFIAILIVNAFQFEWKHRVTTLLFPSTNNQLSSWRSRHRYARLLYVSSVYVDTLNRVFPMNLILWAFSTSISGERLD